MRRTTRRRARWAVLTTAVLAATLGAVAIATPAAATPPLVDITSMECITSGPSYICEITALRYGGWGFTSRWYANNTYLPAEDGRLSIDRSCGVGQWLTVKVEAINYWNACWCVRDTESRRFRCGLSP